MSDSTGTILKIKRFSIHDGPGIRTSVFLKGCPLNCVWCHSPEGIGSDISIWYNKNICITCGKCVNVCPKGALTLNELPEKQISINRQLCETTGDCITICPTNALQFTGWVTTPDKIMEEIEKDISFFKTSAGGVTLTGGEPLFQPGFAFEILSLCKEKDIHTAVETSLFCPVEVLRQIADKVDLFIADLKFIDPKRHQHFTGESNYLVLENLGFLANSGKHILVRVPLVKDITDTYDNKEAILAFIKGLNKDLPVEFIAYNPLAENNYRRLGIPFPLKNFMHV
jgi:pyruvate formate lyase activating enzyme